LSRSYPKAVSTAAIGRLGALLEQAEIVAGAVPLEDLLEAVARTARLDVVLRARYGASQISAAAPPSAPAPSRPRYLDISATAEYMDVSKSTVLRLVKAGKLSVLRPSKGVVRFDRTGWMPTWQRRLRDEQPGPPALRNAPEATQLATASHPAQPFPALRSTDSSPVPCSASPSR